MATEKYLRMNDDSETKVKKSSNQLSSLKDIEVGGEKCLRVYSSSDDRMIMSYTCTMHAACRVIGRWIRLPDPFG